MATGAYDSNKVWIYGEDDSEATFSALLNKSGSSVSTQLTAAPRKVADAAARDALFPSPVQGNSVYRNDLGLVQTYSTLYNSSTNPGGRDSAGWWSTARTDGLVPIMPTNITNYGVGSTASVNSLGVITFSSCTSININGIFNSNYKNYRIIISGMWVSANAAVYMRLASGNTPYTSTQYFYAGTYGTAGGSSGTVSGTNQDKLLLGSLDGSGVDDLCHMTMDIISPNTSGRTAMQIKNMSYIASTNYITYNHSGLLNWGYSADGIVLLPAGGTIGAGSLQVFGYND